MNTVVDKNYNFSLDTSNKQHIFKFINLSKKSTTYVVDHDSFDVNMQCIF